ncbi:MAG: FKBP-type peptidyl-prolyl cis-trans isomerase [Acidobacteriota bacterium]
MYRTLAVLLIFVLMMAGCNPGKNEAPGRSASSPTPYVASTPEPSASKSVMTEGMTTTPSGLQYQEIEVGTGVRPLFNQTVRVRYSGTFPDGVVFDSNLGDGKAPLEFTLGRREVIKGWEMGIGGGPGIPPMQVGGRRKLIVPPDLGYGSGPYGPIPANSTLLFDVTLVGIKR